MRYWIVFPALFLILAGCTGFSLVQPSRHDIGRSYSVETPIAWSRASTSAVETWTVDGFLLQSLRLYAGLPDGEPLLDQNAEDVPVFRKDMLAGEVVEFVVDSIVQDGGTNVTSSGLRPAPFGAAPGFRFDLTFLSETGLEMRGLGAAAVIDDHLHLILYTGAASYYFPKHEDHVNRMIDSVRLSGEAVPS